VRGRVLADASDQTILETRQKRLDHSTLPLACCRIGNHSLTVHILLADLRTAV
jgi:hypothetical protein